jgi:hypothetical protein
MSATPNAKYNVRVVCLTYHFNDLTCLRKYLAEGRIALEDRVFPGDSDFFVLVGDLANESDEAFDARLATATEHLPSTPEPSSDSFEAMRARQRVRLGDSIRLRRPPLPLREFIWRMPGY